MVTGVTSDGSTIWTQIRWETPTGTSMVISIDNGSSFELLLNGEFTVVPDAPGLAVGPIHQG